MAVEHLKQHALSHTVEYLVRSRRRYLYYQLKFLVGKAGSAYLSVQLDSYSTLIIAGQSTIQDVIRREFRKKQLRQVT